MTQHFRAVTSFSLFPTMVDKANSLIAMISSHKDQEDTLSACAALVLAAALDQSTLSAIAHAAANYENVFRERAPAEFADLREASFRKRVIHLPGLLSGGKLTLDKRNDHCRHLHDLINLRNDLMHVVEEPQIRKVSLPWPEEIDLPSHINIDMSKLIDPSQLPLQWLSVTADKVLKFRSAVEIYADEVLFPDGGEIRRGKLVVPESNAYRGR